MPTDSDRSDGHAAIHFADQLRAAGADARSRLERLGPLARDVPGPWLAEHLARVLADAEIGALRPCEHLTASPEPIYQLAHLARELFCLRCLGAASAALLGTPENGRCDICRRGHRRLNLSTLLLGPFVVTIGYCGGCRTQVVA